MSKAFNKELTMTQDDYISLCESETQNHPASSHSYWGSDLVWAYIRKELFGRKKKLPDNAPEPGEYIAEFAMYFREESLEHAGFNGVDAPILETQEQADKWLRKAEAYSRKHPKNPVDVRIIDVKRNLVLSTTYHWADILKGMQHG
jgi:hypothetical protein